MLAQNISQCFVLLTEGKPIRVHFLICFFNKNPQCFGFRILLRNKMFSECSLKNNKNSAVLFIVIVPKAAYLTVMEDEIN